MSSEKMLGVPPKYAPVMELEVERRPCRSRNGRVKVVIALLVIVGMAVMFTGGYYTGRNHDGHGGRHHDSAPPQSYRLQTADGSYADLTPLRGNQPPQDFLQCRSVTVDGESQCVPSNPVLTPKGTLQMTLYEYNGQLTVIVTGTGSQYGEMSSGRSARSTSSPEQEFSVHARNYHGYMVKPSSDDYHTNMEVSHYPHPSEASSTSHLRWSSHNSSSILLQLNRTAVMPADDNKIALYFKRISPTTQFPSSTIRGGDNLSHWDIDFPTEDKPMYIYKTPPTLKLPAPELPTFVEPEEQFINLKDSQLSKSNIFLGSMASLRGEARRRRSLTSADQSHNGAIFKLFDKNDASKALSTVRIIGDRTHGGKNGTIMFDITNHTTQCRAQFSMLFHNALFDGSRMENTTHHQLYMYRHTNLTHTSMAMWKGVTPSENPHGSRSTPLVGTPPAHLDCISHELDQLHQRLDETQKQAGSTRQRRGLSWKCGWGKSIYDGAKCGYGGYKCAKDIGETEETFGLSLFEGAKDCYDAVDTCGDFISTCA